MRTIFKVVAFPACLGLIVAGTAYAQGASEKLVRDLLRKSGLEQLTEELPAIFQEGIGQAAEQDAQLKKLPRHALQEIREEVAKAYAPPKTREVLAKSIGEGMSAAEIRSILKWLDGPLGKKCTKLEKDAMTRQGLEKMAAFAQQLQKKPPPSARFKLIRELDRVTHATTTSVAMFINTHLAVATAMTLSLPPETRKPLAQIEEELEASRPGIEKAIQEQTWVSLLYTYRPLSDAEIRAYIGFADSPVGRNYHRVTIEGFQEAMVRCGAEFGRAMARVFENRDRKSET